MLRDRGQDRERAVAGGGIALSLRSWKECVLGDVRAHAQRARQGESHARAAPFLRAYSPSAIKGKYCGYM